MVVPDKINCKMYVLPTLWRNGPLCSARFKLHNTTTITVSRSGKTRTVWSYFANVLIGIYQTKWFLDYSDTRFFLVLSEFSTLFNVFKSQCAVFLTLKICVICYGIKLIVTVCRIVFDTDCSYLILSLFSIYFLPSRNVHI